MKKVTKLEDQGRLFWNLDTLGESLQTGRKRVFFLEALEQRMKRTLPEMTAKRDLPCVDDHWQVWMPNLQEVGQMFYGKERRGLLTSEEKEMGDDKRRLLRKRALAREDLAKAVAEYGDLVEEDLPNPKRNMYCF